MESLLLCTDLDRTLLPNGEAAESPSARECFAQLADRPEIILAYVSGRHLASVEAAIEQYMVPRPDYAICDVGASIYQSVGSKTLKNAENAENAENAVGDWQLLESWRTQMERDWPEGSVALAQQLLRDMPELSLQEAERQSGFKLSYYAPAIDDPRPLIEGVRDRLDARGLEAALIYSIDDNHQRGLLDLLPPKAGKLSAIEHLLELRNLSRGDAIFAGDSGNDLQVLVSSVPAVLVSNASENLRGLATEGSEQQGNAAQLYLARGGFHRMNGNYAAGILEGLAHYHPQTEAWWT